VINNAAAIGTVFELYILDIWLKTNLKASSKKLIACSLQHLSILE